MNRLNRRWLYDENKTLTSSIKMSDYSIGPVADNCFDLFYIATKK